MKGIVFDIQRFCVNDGPGIRTTVFLKGCMLDCLWCHNPESKSPKPILMLNDNKCIGCLECRTICQNHKFSKDNIHLIDREKCNLCGECVNKCVGALDICGKEMTINDIILIVLKDLQFYNNSGGGLTISGGEPLMQHEFIKELLKKAKENNLNTAIETCGYAKWDSILELVPYVDTFLWDVKETNDELHKKYTRVSNKLILENLYKLNKTEAKIILRCPIIPGYNDREDHFEAIGRMANELENVLEVHIEPYHPLGKDKCKQIGEEYLLGDLSFSDEKTITEWITKINRYTSKLVKKA